MIKTCLFCQTDFEAKRDTAKFCSDNCRVKWNYKNRNKSNGEIKPFQMQVLYTEIMKAVEIINGKNNLPQPVGFVADKPKVKFITRSAEQWHELKRSCESQEEWMKVKEQILNDPNLPDKTKSLIINTP
jgi:predicted nucleic acid-binding Zn ribbon protein